MVKSRPYGVGGMVRLAALVAIIILMAFTPLGYFRYGALSITFIMIPVVIGAVILGPGSGAILGMVFGFTSFAQCFGLDPFGTFLFSVNPLATIIMCFVPRILMGFLSGLIFRVVHKIDKTRFLSYAIASLSGAVLNTVMFISLLVLFFGNIQLPAAMGGIKVIQIVGVTLAVNALVEALVCLVVGAAISKALQHFLPAGRDGKTN